MSVTTTTNNNNNDKQRNPKRFFSHNVSTNIEHTHIYDINIGSLSSSHINAISKGTQVNYRNAFCGQLFVSYLDI